MQLDQLKTKNVTRKYDQLKEMAQCRGDWCRWNTESAEWQSIARISRMYQPTTTTGTGFD